MGKGVMGAKGCKGERNGETDGVGDDSGGSCIYREHGRPDGVVYLGDEDIVIQ